MKLWSETILPGSYNRIESGLQHKGNMVFLHGTGSSSAMWRQQVKYFSAKGYVCTLIDLRGHGASHEPYEKTDITVHKKDVLETLAVAKINSPAYFVGHSLGAILSMSIAEENPHLVKRVFAACLPGKILPPVLKGFELLISGPLQALKDSDLKQYLGWREQILVEMPIYTLREIANNFADIDYLNKVPAVKCPVHLASARFDPVAVCWQSKKIQQKIPGSTLKTFEWAGHNVMDYRADDFNQWIASYLD